MSISRFYLDLSSYSLSQVSSSLHYSPRCFLLYSQGTTSARNFHVGRHGGGSLFGKATRDQGWLSQRKSLFLGSQDLDSFCFPSRSDSTRYGLLASRVVPFRFALGFCFPSRPAPTHCVPSASRVVLLQLAMGFCFPSRSAPTHCGPPTVRVTLPPTHRGTLLPTSIRKID